MLDSDQLSDLIQSAAIPGISMVTLSKGAPPVTRVAGVLDISSPDSKVNPDSRFEAASLSKPLFAYLVMKLHQKGLFDINKPLGDYHQESLINGVGIWHNITAVDVLKHQTGFPGCSWKPGMNVELAFEPRQQYQYSGLAYFYCQKVIERHLGKSLESLAKAHIFEPLKMHNSSFVRPDSNNIAARHDDKMQPKPGAVYEACSANSLHTTAYDYGLFLQSCMNDKSLHEMFAFEDGISLLHDKWAKAENVVKQDLQSLAWGIGWGLQKAPGGTIAFHWGDMGDTMAFAAFNLKTKQGIVYFANSCNGLVVANDLVTPVVNDIAPSLRFLSKKYGFEVFNTPGWKTEQRPRMQAIFKRQEPLAWEWQQASRKPSCVEIKSSVKALNTGNAGFFKQSRASMPKQEAAQLTEPSSTPTY